MDTHCKTYKNRYSRPDCKSILAQDSPQKYARHGVVILQYSKQQYPISSRAKIVLNIGNSSLQNTCKHYLCSCSVTQQLRFHSLSSVTVSTVRVTAKCVGSDPPLLPPDIWQFRPQNILFNPVLPISIPIAECVHLDQYLPVQYRTVAFLKYSISEDVTKQPTLIMEMGQWSQSVDSYHIQDSEFELHRSHMFSINCNYL